MSRHIHKRKIDFIPCYSEGAPLTSVGRGWGWQGKMFLWAAASTAGKSPFTGLAK